jgi:hypothetical protein
MNIFIVAAPNIVFVEPSDRIKELISQDISIYNQDIILKRKATEFNVKYMKTISYLYDGDNNVVIIDKEFNDMFSTAFVKINNLPEVFIARLDTYKLAVYLLYKQLKFVYDEKDIIISKFRRDVYDKIINLQDGCFEK